MEKEPQKKQDLEDIYVFYKHDIEDIYLNAKIPNSLLKDLQKWSKEQPFRRFLTTKLYDWAFKQKQEKLLVQSAKVSVVVIGMLLKIGVPPLVVDVYLSLLLKNKQRIEKYLKHQEAQKQFTYVPPTLIISYLSLYKIHLTQKQKHSLIQELVQRYETCTEYLWRLPELFGEKAYYTDFLIKELQRTKKQNIAGKIMKRLHIPHQKYPIIQHKLIENAAIYMYKKDQSFTWENLEEVFEQFPQALATSIRINVLDRNKRTTKEGFASICKRNPKIFDKLPGKVKQALSRIKQQVPNKLRNNKFQPSDPVKFFSLGDFDYKQKDVIWVNQQNLIDSLEALSQQKLIGIDTQSRVARTCLDSNRSLLATIQIATRKCVFIFDAYMLKQTKIRVPQIEAFFKNKEITIVGHTLSADLNGDVTDLLGFKGQVACKAIDICPIFKFLNPDERKAGLAYISEKVLGKQICKQYTLTNWNRRPLLKNQIHYAALDAVIVIKIWDKLKQHERYQQAELACLKRNRKEQNNKEEQKELKEGEGEQRQQVKGQNEEETMGEKEQQEYLAKQ